ncbi:LOW QUALITY PROTEIN: uncharacterized protein LOC128254582 [Drosophila gunungcola]|uniref:LOW QUALITY PROTEIN: uncharacterized protein LOC128254582 n=1 Tax=Drosophila gunungcola TaxID=103775 RepID=UPI0022DFAC88|nr:LOW QUALITY PROTEIN: uncharacterized protein LOC128254582 [Drosophila gunungcola]
MLTKMLPRSLLLIIGGLWLIILLVDNCSGKRKWDYEPLSIEAYSTDESMLKITARVERVGRGEFAISANIDFKYEPGDTTLVEALGYRSSSGNENDYKLIPFSIPKQPFTQFMNSHYKDVVIANLGGCSNLIQFEDQFEPPWPQKEYVLDKCVANSDGFPEVVPEGFYKVNFSMMNPVDWGFIVIVKISTKIM